MGFFIGAALGAAAGLFASAMILAGKDNRK